MTRVNFSETTIHSVEMDLPAWSSTILDEEDHDGYPWVQTSGTAILADGRSLNVSVRGHRAYADFGGEEFTSAEVKVTFDRGPIAEGRFGSEPADREGFAQVLAVLEGLIDKVRAEMREA